MAKCGPFVSLAQMEQSLGYELTSFAESQDEQRYYSNLSPVPQSTYDQTRKELEEHLQAKRRADSVDSLEKMLPEPGVAQRIAGCHDYVLLERRNPQYQYSVSADVHCALGFHLPLQLTKKEASVTMSVARLGQKITPRSGLGFLKLPRELRDRIYSYAIPPDEWKVVNADYLGGVNLSRGIGDPTGFYYPLRDGVSLLKVSRQIRGEVLPLIYRSTKFRLGDMDDFIKLAISVGEIGRQNIESLEFLWQSRSDMEATTDNEPDIEDPYSKMPTLHAVRCVQLLRQIKRLKFLRLLFPDGMISDKSKDELELNSGIDGLFSIRGIQTVEIQNEYCESIEMHGVLKELKEKMESSETLRSVDNHN